MSQMMKQHVRFRDTPIVHKSDTIIENLDDCNDTFESGFKLLEALNIEDSENSSMISDLDKENNINNISINVEKKFVGHTPHSKTLESKKSQKILQEITKSIDWNIPFVPTNISSNSVDYTEQQVVNKTSTTHDEYQSITTETLLNGCNSTSNSSCQPEDNEEEKEEDDDEVITAVTQEAGEILSSMPSSNNKYGQKSPMMTVTFQLEGSAESHNDFVRRKVVKTPMPPKYVEVATPISASNTSTTSSQNSASIDRLTSSNHSTGINNDYSPMMTTQDYSSPIMGPSSSNNKIEFTLGEDTMNTTNNYIASTASSTNTTPLVNPTPFKNNGNSVIATRRAVMVDHSTSTTNLIDINTVGCSPIAAINNETNELGVRETSQHSKTPNVVHNAQQHVEQVNHTAMHHAYDMRVGVSLGRGPNMRKSIVSEEKKITQQSVNQNEIQSQSVTKTQHHQATQQVAPQHITDEEKKTTPSNPLPSHHMATANTLSTNSNALNGVFCPTKQNPSPHLTRKVLYNAHMHTLVPAYHINNVNHQNNHNSFNHHTQPTPNHDKVSASPKKVENVLNLQAYQHASPLQVPLTQPLEQEKIEITATPSSSSMSTAITRPLVSSNQKSIAKGVDISIQVDEGFFQDAWIASNSIDDKLYLSQMSSNTPISRTSSQYNTSGISTNTSNRSRITLSLTKNTSLASTLNSYHQHQPENLDVDNESCCLDDLLQDINHHNELIKNSSQNQSIDHKQHWSNTSALTSSLLTHRPTSRLHSTTTTPSQPLSSSKNSSSSSSGNNKSFDTRVCAIEGKSPSENGIEYSRVVNYSPASTSYSNLQFNISDANTALSSSALLHKSYARAQPGQYFAHDFNAEDEENDDNEEDELQLPVDQKQVRAENAEFMRDVTILTDIAVANFTSEQMQREVTDFDFEAESQNEESNNDRTFAETTITLEKSFSPRKNDSAENNFPRLSVCSLARNSATNANSQPQAHALDIKELLFDTAPGEFTTVMLRFTNNLSHSITLQPTTALVRFESLLTDFMPQQSTTTTAALRGEQREAVLRRWREYNQSIEHSLLQQQEREKNIFTVSPNDVIVRAGEHANLFVTFSPLAGVEGIYTGALRIKHHKKYCTMLLRGEALQRHTCFDRETPSKGSFQQKEHSDHYYVNSSAKNKLNQSNNLQSQVNNTAFNASTQSFNKNNFQERLRILHEKIAAMTKQVIDRNQSATKQERQTIAYQEDYKRETLTTKGNETVLSSQQTAVNNTRSSDSRTKSQPDMNASPAIENENKLFFRRTSMSFDSGEVGTLQRCKLELCNASNREMSIYLGDPAAPFHLLHHEIVMRPRSYVRVPVRFLPTQPGSFKSNLLAQSTDGHHTAIIQLEGHAY